MNDQIDPGAVDALAESWFEDIVRMGLNTALSKDLDDYKDEAADVIRRLRKRGYDVVPGWRDISSAPAFSERAFAWVVGGRFQVPQIVTPDGGYWRSRIAEGGKTQPTHWAPCEPPMPLPRGAGSTEG